MLFRFHGYFTLYCAYLHAVSRSEEPRSEFLLDCEVVHCLALVFCVDFADCVTRSALARFLWWSGATEDVRVAGRKIYSTSMDESDWSIDEFSNRVRAKIFRSDQFQSVSNIWGALRAGASTFSTKPLYRPKWQHLHATARRSSTPARGSGAATPTYYSTRSE